MTSPAILAVLDSPLLVTAKTPAHLQRRNLRYPRHLCDVTMALLALQPGLYMPLVREVNIVRQIMNLDPRDRLFLIPIGGKLLYERRIGLYYLMAAHATLHVRHA